MKKKSLPHVHAKVAKGKTYYYFDLGKDDLGRRVLKRLPDIRSHGFTAAYQAAKGMRTKRDSGDFAKNFDWLCRIYEKSPEFQALAENSKRLYLRHLRYATENFRSKTDRSWPLAIITSEHVLTLRDKFADQPGKANATLRSLGALFAWASKPGRKYMPTNIAAGVDLLETGEHEAWPKWLVEDALNDPEIRLPVALLYYLGQRIGDTVKMGRHGIVRGVMGLTQQKTGKALRIAVHSRLAEIIELDVPKDQLMFLLAEKGTPVTESGLRQRLQKWAKDKHGVHIVPHGLRRNAVNALLEAECSVAEIASITGQSLQMIEHYSKERDGEHLSTSAILKFERKTNQERANRG
jgi:integrase